MGRVLSIALLAGWAVWLMADFGVAQSPSEAVSFRGFLFVNGRYLPAPHSVAVDQDSIQINGVEYAADEFYLAGFRDDRRRSRYWGERRGGRRGLSKGGPGVWPEAVQQSRSLEQLKDKIDLLRVGGFLVLMSGHQPIDVVDPSGVHDLLQALVSDSGNPGFSPSDDPSVLASLQPVSAAVETAGEQFADVGAPFLRGTAQQNAWVSFRREFVASDAFEQHSAQYLEMARKVGEESRRAVASSQFYERFAYPLTVLAMVLVVLGFGHLLSNRPTLAASSMQQGQDSVEFESDYRQQTRKVVGLSLLIVVLLASIDLLFTLSSHQAGVMRELNPMGRGLITEPMHLFLFKAVLTVGAVGILYRLHCRPVAQLASWWCCLLMTLLTARWVMLQSMFL